MYAAEFKREEYDNVQEDENVKETKTKFQICHLETGLFLCESGEEKFHPSSDRRYTVTIRDLTETNWTEEKQSEKPGICFYKNCQSNGYLGYDPNGDHVYTKDEPHEAEEWSLISDELSSSGDIRSVVIFANYGQKYLAVRNGSLTGTAEQGSDCVWQLIIWS